MISSKMQNPEEAKMNKPKLCGLFFRMPRNIKNIISLFLPIEDIPMLKSVDEDNDYNHIHCLLHASEQNQLFFSVTRDMQRVWSRDHLSLMGIKFENCYNVCVTLGKIQRLAFDLSNKLTTRGSGVKASTRDEPTQDIDRTLDGFSGTWWSSDGSKCQEKIDWLLYDLGTVAVITQISIAAFKANFHMNSPVYGFKK